MAWLFFVLGAAACLWLVALAVELYIGFKTELDWYSVSDSTGLSGIIARWRYDRKVKKDQDEANAELDALVKAGKLCKLGDGIYLPTADALLEWADSLEHKGEFVDLE